MIEKLKWWIKLWVLKNRYKSGKPQMVLLPKSITAILILLAMSGADAYNIVSTFLDTIADEMPFVVLGVVVLIIALDVAPSIAANNIKAAKEHLIPMRTAAFILAVSLCAFIVAYGTYFGFRLAAQNRVSVFSAETETDDEDDDIIIGVESTENESSSEEEGMRKAIVVVYLVLPFISSLIAVGVTFATSHPRREYIDRLSSAREECIQEISSSEARYTTLAKLVDSKYINDLIGDDEKAEKTFENTVRDEGFILKESIRVEIAQNAGSPIEVSSIFKKSKKRRK